MIPVESICRPHSLGQGGLDNVRVDWGGISRMDSDIFMDLWLLAVSGDMGRGENKFTFPVLSIGEDQRNVIGNPRI